MQLRGTLAKLLHTFFQRFSVSFTLANQAEEMLDEGIFKMERFVESGWLTGLKYEDEILADLEKRTDSKPNKLKAVSALPLCTLHYLTCICHNTSSTPSREADRQLLSSLWIVASIWLSYLCCWPHIRGNEMLT